MKNTIRLIISIYLFMLSFFVIQGQDPSDFATPFEGNNNWSSSYEQTISYYKKLARVFPQIKMLEAGMTDIGRPLHLIVVSRDGISNPSQIDRTKQRVLLINNAIHPGEPCGVDASMMLARDLVTDSAKQGLLQNTVVLIIPMYNVSGALHRGSTSRVNQNGPEEYGFRGNVRHLDLNRDFVKAMSKNARSFNRLFTTWQPDMMIDNHTSNGADYSYTMTLIATQKDKLAPPLAGLLQDSILPFLYARMKSKNWPMTPYVYARNTPDGGIAGFLDLPRYSSGYAALHHCIAFMPESHMLKPFKDRVQGTYSFMLSALEYLDAHGRELQLNKARAEVDYQRIGPFPIAWQLDERKKSKIWFEGYQARYKKSRISGHSRLYYDRSGPYKKQIDYWNSYRPTQKITKPKAYIIPQAYEEVIARLRNNGVEMERLVQDTTLEVTMYYIKDYETVEKPYEGRYLHYNTHVELQKRRHRYYKGDYVVHMNQRANRYLLETLEPQAPDSFFSWGFFDGILMRKEHFSPYVFEDLAPDILNTNPELQKALETKRQRDTAFAKDGYAQLNFIYTHSKYAEDSFMLYPVGRIE